MFPLASVQFSTSVAGSIDGPQAFDLVITFPTPFHYNPAQGNLLVDIRNASGTSHDPANDQEIDATSTAGDATSRVYNLGDVNAPSAGTTGSSFQMDTLGAVMRFVSTPTAPTVTPPHTLLNSATRMRVGTGDNVLIGGFIIRGGSKKVILRAIGPSLTNAGVPGALADPALELHGGAGELITQTTTGFRVRKSRRSSIAGSRLQTIERRQSSQPWGKGITPRLSQELAVLRASALSRFTISTGARRVVCSTSRRVAAWRLAITS